MTQIDTSGCVREHLAAPANVINRYWSDLSPFTQGFIEAALVSVTENLMHGNGIYNNAKFSDLAPETLARFMEDCAKWCELDRGVYSEDTQIAGHALWAMRNSRFGAGEKFPPLHIYLADDGKVRIGGAL